MGARIFIVEDEKIIQKVIEKILLSFGYEICGKVESGELAIKQALEAHPDLILMDIHLKDDIDGITVAEMIHKQEPIPIIYLTAYADDVTLQRAKITEPFGYIIKPFEQRDLVTNIEISLYKHQIINQIQEREKTYRRLDEESEAGVLVLEKGKISYINQKCATLLAMSQDDLLKWDILKFLSLFHPEDSQKFIQKIVFSKMNSSEKYGDKLRIRVGEEFQYFEVFQKCIDFREESANYIMFYPVNKPKKHHFDTMKEKSEYYFEIAKKYEYLDELQNQLNITITEAISENDQRISFRQQEEKIINLNLIDCKMDQIPRGISIFKYLAKLNLRENQIKKIPQEISALQNLLELDLSKNQIKDFPIFLSDGKIENLNLSNNPMASIQLKNWAHLKRLYLNSLNLEKLVIEQQALQKLIHFEASNNNLTEFPPELLQLPNLESIILNKNSIQIVPDSLEMSSSITIIELGKNNLTTIPDSILNLPHLKILRISGNPIEIQSYLPQLSHLEIVFVDKYQLTKIPLNQSKNIVLCPLYGDA